MYHYNDEIPIPNPSSDIDSSLCTSSDEDVIECNEIYQPIEEKIEPQLFDQAELNDLIRDLGLSKESSQLLGSRLKEKHLLRQRHLHGIDIEMQNSGNIS